MKRVQFELRPRLILISSVVGLSLVGLAIGSSLIQTYRSVNALRDMKLDQASLHARQARPVSVLLDTLTAQRFNTIHAWAEGLGFIQALTNAKTEFSPFASPDTSNSKIRVLVNRGLTVGRAVTHSWVIQRLAPAHYDQIQKLTASAEVINRHLIEGEHTYLLVFQNTDEVRGTGGFMGSYATVNLKDGLITNLDIEDIYQPDGQFTGYVEAPPGVREYLSSGKGIRLPDANWWPDFPSSAQKMLPFFGLGRERAIEGIVAVNLTVAEQLLQITGPVFLPDYQTTVTSDNIAQVARADRDEFFPGSQSKPHFLSSLFNQIKFKLADLSPDQQKELVRMVIANLRTKNLQLYSNQPELQALFEQYRLAGQTTAMVGHQPADLYLMLIESNVGINKANRGVQRKVKLEVSDYRTRADITFTNTNRSTTPQPVPTAQPQLDSGTTQSGAAEADHLHYINYQRLLLQPTTEVKHLAVQGIEITKRDEAIITTASGEQLKQVGFLMDVPEGQTVTLTLELTHPPLGDHPLLWLQKQSGLPPTPYTVTFGQQTKDLLLEADEAIQF